MGSAFHLSPSGRVSLRHWQAYVAKPPDVTRAQFLQRFPGRTVHLGVRADVKAILEPLHVCCCMDNSWVTHALASVSESGRLTVVTGEKAGVPKSKTHELLHEK